MADFSGDHQIIKAVVFDKDGVLLDFSRSWSSAFRLLLHYCVALSGNRLTETQISDFLGMDARGHIASTSVFASGTLQDATLALGQAFPILSRPLSDAQTLIDIENAMLAQSHQYTALGDVTNSLQRLLAMGCRLMVLTNDNAEMTKASLSAIQIYEYFEAIMTADQGYGGKPEPKGLLAMLAAARLRPDQVVLVGDTLADVQVAARAGVRHFIGISDAFPKPTLPLVGCDSLLPDIAGLPDLLVELS